MSLTVAFFESQPPFSPTAGGIASYVQHRAFVLAGQGVDVWWFNNTEIAHFDRRALAWEPVRQLQCSPLRRQLLGRYPRLSPALGYLVGGRRVDVIEFPEHVAAPLPVAWAGRRGVKTVIQCHTGEHLRYFLNAEHHPARGLKLRWRARHVHDNLLNADGVLACSHEIALLTAGFFKVHPDRFTVVPHALSRAAQPGLDMVSDGEDDRFFLVVGNSEFCKSTDLVFRALDIYRQKGGRRPLLWAGPRAAPPGLTLSARENVSFLGPVEKTELAKLRIHATAVVVASRFESFSMVAGEAFLNGCPVILSSRAGIRSLAERYQAALVVDPLNSPALAAALKAAEDTALRRRLRLSEKKLADYLTSEELSLRTADFYRSVAGA